MSSAIGSTNIQNHSQWPICSCLHEKTGVSAIEKFYQILQGINELERQRHLSYHNPLFEDPMNVAPINFGTARGGEWHSTVPNEVIVEGRYGILPGECITEAKAAFSKALHKVAVSDIWLKDHPPTLEWFEGQFESGQTDQDEPILSRLGDSHVIMSGKEPALQGVTYGSDLRLFTNHGKVPAVLYGPGSVSNAHSVDEYINLEEVVMCTKVLAHTIYEWCGGEGEQ